MNGTCSCTKWDAIPDSLKLLLKCCFCHSLRSNKTEVSLTSLLGDFFRAVDCFSNNLIVLLVSAKSSSKGNRLLKILFYV